MEKQKLKELIVEHKERFLSRTGLIEREIQKSLERYLKQKEIILITGVRRSGKSSLLRLICDDVITGFDAETQNILYLNFEDERFIDFSVRDFGPLYEAFVELENPEGRKYFFLDELQNITGWEKWINRLCEFEDVKIFITGSNAALLGSEISTALTGRNRQVVNWPFSFTEFLALKERGFKKRDLYHRDRRVEIRRLFDEYVSMGGFPEVLKINDVTLLEQYFKDIVYRDVIARHAIKNIKEIKELALFLASHTGTVQSYKNLQSLIKVKSVNTVKNYLEALSDVFLFFYIDLFDFSIKRQIYNPSKVYCIDTALLGAVSFKFSRNIGHIYENMVFLELIRNNEEIFYWKSGQSYEVDFVTRKGLKIDKAIQVTLSIAETKVKDREIKALTEAKKALSPERFIIITEDEEGTEQIGDIKIEVIPLWKFLLSGL